MKLIIAYLMLIAGIDVTLIAVSHSTCAPQFLRDNEIIVLCALAGGIGGVVYCLRGVYLNACVRKAWDNEWWPWYFIRPVVSHLCGAVSFLFLRAGLVLLEAAQKHESTKLGYLALAFVAGLNVDKFIAKIEDIAQATWGIEKSRAQQPDETKKT